MQFTGKKNFLVCKCPLRQQQQYSLFNEGDVINPMSYLTYGLHSKYIYKIMTYQQNDLLREKLKLEIVWFNTDMI